jgi:NAD(P)-dependent dehydrogenase (short-subunit alcohol dehydrogenase family)
MSNTVLITGASTGIGRASAKAFHKAGWNVIATMRSPEREQELQQLPNTIVLRLDVNEQASIEAAIAQGLSHFGRIDALVNNAGYSLTGAFETFSDAQVRKQFDTNVFGLMAVTRAMLPHFRANGAGNVVNVASVGGRTTFPLYSVYHGTKWAVDGFSESLAYELGPKGIRVKIIEPGAIATDFYGRSTERDAGNGVTAYDDYSRRLLGFMDKAGNRGAAPEVVARAIVRAAGDRSSRLRYTVGIDARFALLFRRLLPERLFIGVFKLALRT